MMKVTTKTGDDQTTFLRVRRPKDDLQVEVLGLIDECLAQCILINLEIDDTSYGLGFIIGHLNEMLAYLAIENHSFSKDNIKFVEDFVEQNQWIFKNLNYFVQATTLPAAKLNILRTKVRTLERRFASLAKIESISSTVLIYLNRLSDYFFVSMLIANQHGQED